MGSPPCRGDKFCAPNSWSLLGLGIGLPSIAFAPARAYLKSLGNGQHSHFLDILCMNFSHHFPPSLHLLGAVCPIFSIQGCVIGCHLGLKYSQKDQDLPFLLSGQPAHFHPVKNT